MFGNQVMKYYISASASDGHSALWWKLSWDGGSRGSSLPLLVHSYQDGMVDSSCFLLWHFMITLKRRRDREPMGGDCPFLLSWCLMEFWILVLGPSPIAEFLEGITAEGCFDLGGGGGDGRTSKLSSPWLLTEQCSFLRTPALHRTMAKWLNWPVAPVNLDKWISQFSLTLWSQLLVGLLQN